MGGKQSVLSSASVVGDLAGLLHDKPSAADLRSKVVAAVQDISDLQVDQLVGILSDASKIEQRYFNKQLLEQHVRYIT